MALESLINHLVLWGSVVFALSGVVAAQHKPLDIFGVTVVAGATAVGGGSLRDVMLGQPVFWLEDVTILTAIFLTAIFAFFFIRHYQWSLDKLLVPLDAAGLAVFTILGMKKAVLLGVPLISAMILGVMTGVAGGAIRDILVGETPFIMQKDLYATASFAGTILFALGLYFHLQVTWVLVLAMSTIFLVRMLAYHMNWHFPQINQR